MKTVARTKMVSRFCLCRVQLLHSEGDRCPMAPWLHPAFEGCQGQACHPAGRRLRSSLFLSSNLDTHLKTGDFRSCCPLPLAMSSIEIPSECESESALCPKCTDPGGKHSFNQMSREGLICYPNPESPSIIGSHIFTCFLNFDI